MVALCYYAAVSDKTRMKGAKQRLLRALVCRSGGYAESPKAHVGLGPSQHPIWGGERPLAKVDWDSSMERKYRRTAAGFGRLARRGSFRKPR